MARKKKGKGKGKKKSGGGGGAAAAADNNKQPAASASASAAVAAAPPPAAKSAAKDAGAAAPSPSPGTKTVATAPAEAAPTAAPTAAEAVSSSTATATATAEEAASALEAALKLDGGVIGPTPNSSKKKQHQHRRIQSHDEMHLRPSEAIAACDGDDSASRSGSETDEVAAAAGAVVGAAAGGANVTSSMITVRTANRSPTNDSDEKERGEHVLFEEGAVEIGGGSVGGNGNDGSPTVRNACQSWADRGDLDSDVEAAASYDEERTTPRMSWSAHDIGTVDVVDISGEMTPKVRPACIVPGPGDAASAPPMPTIALTQPASPAAVHVAPNNGPIGPVSLGLLTGADRRISDVTAPSLHPTPVTSAGDVRTVGDDTRAGGSPVPVMPAVSDLSSAASASNKDSTTSTSGAATPAIPHPPRMSPVKTSSAEMKTVTEAPSTPTPSSRVPGPGVFAALSPPRLAAGTAASPGTPASAAAATASSTPVAINTTTTDGRIHLGICAMDKKARSKPMGEILSRLDETLFEVVFFGDALIKNAPIEEWPVVDVLIAFFSSGYPLAKAEEYVQLRKPFVLNDLAMQWTLKDRRRVYDLLESSGIDVPRHIYMSRDGYVTTAGRKKDGTTGGGSSTTTGTGNGGDGDLIEHDDHIEVNGVVINKPFVEKPVDADDHNIAIYYPSSAGGGCKKLFRKVGDRSSEFYSDINEVRRDGSYIYEEFVETQGTDVKMYTVGPDYGHAEARKSPTVDGKVERNSDGKEVRFPVILTLREKEIARRIVIVFKQQVCGFDLLRVQEGDSMVSYVCDVNGWSFVKNSRKYYDDCAQILTEHMLAAVKPNSLSCFSALDPLLTTISDVDNRPDTPKKPPLRKTASAIQRVSRMLQGGCEPPMTPKESSMSPVRLDGGDSSSMTPSLSAPTTLEEGAMPVSQIPHQLATNPPSIVTSAASSVVDDGDAESLTREPSTVNNGGANATHKEELRCVIAVVRHGDRTPKQKLKINISEPRVLQYFDEYCASSKKDLKVKNKKPMEEFLKTIILMISEKEAEAKALGTKRHLQNDDKQMLYKLRHMRDVLQRWKIGGLNRKLQIKPRKWDQVEDNDGTLKCTEVQLILKWGGNLTKLGERQSISLGQRLRHELYPDAPGGGILRLHSTFRHDLKIKTSDEGRVMKTAAASAKGLLELEGEIPPILVSLVHKEKDSIHMLDPSGNKEVKKELEECKSKINANLQKDFDFDKTTVEEHEEIVGPATLVSLHKALQEVGNPRKTMFAILSTMGELLEQLDEMLGLMTSGDESRNEGGEGLRGEGEGALSGIKLYKGETLLELTERWRLLYRKFYDEDKDVFDLSRVPDVHDNVRFDMLHNPHLGLTATLEKLYNMAKVMADCVVPQEYGSTILEKRSIGQKMCRALLDKIKYDLIIARTDNQVDMRYMINMDYSADLPINTMGRRIRTRLYFTSESHLHTLLNVLRFTSDDPQNDRPLLSKRGRQVVDETPELCYLTQVVFRLFEDPKKDISDPKRFRIEIFFSPGATATPLHMAEMDRDLDNSRFETDPLEVISKENLSCNELEDYFSEAIKEGKTDEDDDASIISTAASMEDKKKKKEKKEKQSEKEAQQAEAKAQPAVAVGLSVEATKTEATQKPNAIIKEKKTAESVSPPDAVGAAAESSVDKPEAAAETSKGGTEQIVKSRGLDFGGESGEPGGGEDEAAAKTEAENDEERLERMARILEKKYFWTSVAAISFIMGVGCLFLSRSMGDRTQRRWSKRR